MEIVKVREDLGVRMYMVLDNDGREIAYCSQGSSEQNLAAAERMAAMWDALRGFTTEEIKAGLDLAAINLALKANKAMLAAETARADKAEQQRGELLAALEELVLKVERDVAYACTPVQLVKARCVLKIVKGGE